jgi:hypothetical protein
MFSRILLQDPKKLKWAVPGPWRQDLGALHQAVCYNDRSYEELGMQWRGCAKVEEREHLKGPGLVWLMACTLLALILRAYRVDFQPLWWDEGWTVYFATADVPSMIARTAIDIHPPFYYLVLHFWTLICGPSAVSVRLFSVGVGTLSIPLMFLLARRLLGRRTALIAALILAVAPFHVYYSQEARMYALVTLLLLASHYLFLLLLEEPESRTKRRVYWILYVFITTMAMYTQYYAAFLPAAQTLFLFLRFRRHKDVLPRWIVAQAALLLAYLPWLLYAGPRLVAYVGNKLVKEGDVPAGLWTYLYSHFVAFSVGHLSEDRHLLSLLAVVFAALALVGAIACFVGGRRVEHAAWPTSDSALYAIVCLFIPLTLGYVVNLRFPFTSPAIERLFLFSVPAFYILVAVGVSWLSLRLRVPGAVVVLLVLVVSTPPLLDFYSSERYVGDDYRPVVKKVQALARPEDVIVAVHPWQIGYFQAYYSGELPDLYLTPKEALDVTSERWAADRGLMVRDLDSLLERHRFLCFPAHQALGRIIETQVEGYLFEQQYPILNEWFSQSTRLSCHTATREMTEVAEGTNFGDKVSLLKYALTPNPDEAGWGAALVELRWKVEGELQGKYQMALRLVDEQGRVWAAEDREPLGGLRPFDQQPVGSEVDDHQALLVPAGTPPGSYQLELGLYRLENGEWLDVLDEVGTPQGVQKALGEVSVSMASVPPPEEALFIQHPRTADFTSGVRFLGYSIGGESCQPGDTLDLTLFWKALADLHEDYHFSLRLEDGDGTAWATIDDQPAGSGYPTSLWMQGQLLRGLFRLMVPASTPSGQYRLVLTLYDPLDGRPVPWRQWLLDRGQTYTLGPVVVQGRAHQTEPPPSIQHPVSARLGESIQLLGYDLDQQEVAAGDTLRLTLYWQALSEMDTSYTVFNHLIDDGDRIWGQRDGIPGSGALPTSSWISGEYVVDEYEIPVQADTPPGEYLIETGVYDLTTMLRLPVVDSEGAVLGDRILLEATPVWVR